MSHNSNKVNAQEPDRLGAISQSLSDLNDVTISSAADGEFMQYDNSSSSWKNVTPPAATSFNYLQIGQGESNAYSNAGAGTNISVGNKLRFYDSSIVNNIAGASVTTSGTNWVEYISLPSGNYIIFVTYGVEFSASGVLVYQIGADTGSGYNIVAFNAAIGEDVTSYDFTAGQIVTYLSLSSSADIAVIVQAVSNVDTVANQGNTPAERGSIMILKV